MEERIRLRSARLRNLLRRRRISQNRWALRLGLGRAHLSLLVNGQRPYPSAVTRRKLLKGLGVEFDELFEIEGVRPHLEKSVEPASLPSRERSAPRAGARTMNEHYQNLRFALRSLHRNPSFTVVTLLILGIGIGAATIMLTLVDATLLRPLPFGDPGRLVMVWEHHQPTDTLTNPVSPANFVRWGEETTSFGSLAAFFPIPLNLTGTGQPLRINAGMVSPGFFTTLASPPQLGQGFDDTSENQVILSNGFWERHFGARTDLDNLRVRLEGQESRVVGVMPAEFDLPPGVDLWGKMVMTPRHRVFHGRYMAVLAKLREGVNLKQAQQEMDAWAVKMAEDSPDTNRGWGVHLVALHESLYGNYRSALLILLGAVGMVLLIGCGNIAGLTLARGSTRLQELSIRMTLGARRSTLLRQLLTESLVLGLLGGILGLLFAAGGLNLIPRLIPTDLPGFLDLSLQPQNLLATLGIALGAGLVFGILPALQLTGSSLGLRLKEAGRGTSGASGSQVRGWLISGEIALAVVLLVGAGLLLRSFQTLQAVDPGLRIDGLFSVELSLPRSALADASTQSRFFSELVGQLRNVPGISAVGAISWLPLAGPGSSTSFYPTDRPLPPVEEQPTGAVRIVTPGYFETAGMQILQGRTLSDSAELEDGPRRVVVNESLAERFWPDQSPLGKTLAMQWGEAIEGEIVGVVNDARLSSLDSPPAPTLYWSIRQIPNPAMTILLRSNLDSSSLASTVRTVVAGIDADQPASDIRQMSDVVAASLQPRRFPLILLGFFSLSAFALAAIGIYGLISYAVSRRTREIGLRMAFGANRGDVVRLVFRQGLPRVVVGGSVGLLLAAGLSRYLQSLVFGVTVLDPWTYFGVAALLLGAALLAMVLPARRAIQIDPAEALRAN